MVCMVLLKPYMVWPLTPALAAVNAHSTFPPFLCTCQHINCCHCKSCSAGEEGPLQWTVSHYSPKCSPDWSTRRYSRRPLKTIPVSPVRPKLKAAISQCCEKRPSAFQVEVLLLQHLKSVSCGSLCLMCVCVYMCVAYVYIYRHIYMYLCEHVCAW